jgi:LysR family carnitine catabolism transcriptional activator
VEFREVRSLVALGKLASIAKTAEQLNLTPAAIHKQLKNLEREFGITLYEKTGRSIHLTQAAQVIMPHLDDLVSQYKAIFSALTEWKGLQRGFVRLGANPAVSSFLAPPLLKQFREDWPGLALVLDVSISEMLLDHIADRSLDVAFGIWAPHGLGHATSRARWAYDLVMVTNDERVPEQAALQDLSGFPFIRLPAGSSLSDAIDLYAYSNGLRPSENIIVNNSHTIVSLVRAGMGNSILPHWAVADDVRAGTLRVVRQDEPLLTAQLDLITSRTRYVAPPVKAFIDLARNFSWEHLRLLD